MVAARHDKDAVQASLISGGQVDEARAMQLSARPSMKWNNDACKHNRDQSHIQTAT